MQVDYILRTKIEINEFLAIFYSYLYQLLF